MRYLVFDDEGSLFRKFWDKATAEGFLQNGWRLEVLPKQKKVLPTVETHGEARW